MKQKKTGVRIRIHILNILYSVNFIKLFSSDNNMYTLYRQIDFSYQIQEILVIA